MGDLTENPHPFRQIPCLTDDDVVVFESGAILLYLNSLVPDDDDKAKNAAIASWVSWANASLDPICFLETPDGKVYVPAYFLFFCMEWTSLISLVHICVFRVGLGETHVRIVMILV